MPGDNVTITVELIYPVALNVGLRFAIREGGRTVGAGEVRTPDTRFWRPVLYQLSYSRKNQVPKPYDREPVSYTHLPRA